MNYLLSFLETILSRPFFYKINKFLYFLSLRGLGINNTYSLVEKGDRVVLEKTLSRSNACTVLDVGANVGNYAREVLAHNSKAAIYAFEPHPKTFLTLAEKAKALNFTAVNKGCADVAGMLDFYDYADNDGSEHATLLKEVFSDIYHDKVIARSVEVITLDSFVSANGIGTIDLLKIDTEGYELNVLKGCTDMLKNDQVKAIHFEFNRMNIVGRVFMLDFIKLLPQYDFYRVLQSGLIRIENSEPLLSEIFGFQNVVAINRNVKK